VEGLKVSTTESRKGSEKFKYDKVGAWKEMNCKHLRISPLRKTGEPGSQVDVVQTARCRFKLTGEAKAKEVHLKLLEMGIEKGTDPGVHCPFFPTGDYSICPWYTFDYQ
jgi:hypothetical protein